MCKNNSCICTNPEKLKDKPENCTPEQIAECHPEDQKHPCHPGKDKN